MPRPSTGQAAPSTSRVTRSQGASKSVKSKPVERPILYRFNTLGSSPDNALADDEVDSDIASPLTKYQPFRIPTLQQGQNIIQNTPIPSRRMSIDPALKLVSPLGESNTRTSGLRRARTSGPDKSRKRRSLEKPSETTTVPTVAPRAKPRVSAPSRIPAPIRTASGTSQPTVTAAHLTPERSDGDELVESQEDSLKKLSLTELSSPTKASSSPGSASPSKLTFANIGSLSASHRRITSDLLESLFDTPPSSVKIQALPLEFQPPPVPKTSTFQRQVSHAHVLFGGPAIVSPPEEVPPSSSQTIPGDDDDDEFFRAPSPVQSLRPTDIIEPGLMKKFRPRDSGVVVSDDSEGGGSPPAWKLNFPTVLQERARDKQGKAEDVTPSFRQSKRPSGWVANASAAVQESGADQAALKVLLHGVAEGKDKDNGHRPKTPTKKNQLARMFTSVPRMRATLGPQLANKGRKSMPNTHLDLHKHGESSKSDLPPVPSNATLKSPMSIAKKRPTILMDFIRRQEPSLPSATSVDSVSTISSVENTPTRYHGKHLGRQDFNRRSRATKRPSHQLQVVQSLISDEDEEGRFQNQFNVIEELGQGEFGVALRVHDRLRGHEFAVKKSQRYEGVRHRNRLREEVDALKALKERGGHVNVLEYIDSWDEDDHLYIQTALCAMGNLATFLNEYGKHFDRLEEAYVWKIIAEVGDGLRFIHGNGFIHLDLKPANIFLSDEGRLCIGDFGMASAWPRQTTGDFEREGDREYMAPEILRGVYGKAADVFSLGMMILEAAANIVVPDMGSPWHKLRKEDFGDVQFEGTSGVLVQFIRDLMRTDPAKRLTIEQVCSASVVGRARDWMNSKRREAAKEGRSVILGSALAEEEKGFVQRILGVREGMDTAD